MPQHGESEVHGTSKGASTGLGMQNIAKYLGFDIPVRIRSDACAAIGIARRRKLGKIRHLDVEDLWVQQRIRDRNVDPVKVLGSDHPADMLTKYVAADLPNNMF